MRDYQITPRAPTRAYVIFPNISDSKIQLSASSRLEEACGLARAINLEIVHSEIINLKTIKAGSFFGEGVIERLKKIFAEDALDLLIVDSALSPIQQRNLEKKLTTKVIDRTALILEIFGERAKTKEGKLQVELAHLTYQRSRLVRSWTHLERQRGGAGFLGGPGETQIELDRRIIDDKIVRIKKELEKVRQTRQLQRNAREKIPYPVVALVGYTNAGKSSIFNDLTKANVFAKDLLFATLDPTMRQITLPSGQQAILSDTVGFISDLPHELIMSFRATLEEVLSAQIIVHVRDISNSDTLLQKKDVLKVLEQLGLKNIEKQNNYIELLNKSDLLPSEQRQYYQEHIKNKPNLILTSATNKEGLDKFLQKVEEELSANETELNINIPVAEGKIIAWLYENARVQQKELKSNFIKFTCKISKKNCARLEQLLKNTALPQGQSRK